MTRYHNPAGISIIAAVLPLLPAWMQRRIRRDRIWLSEQVVGVDDPIDFLCQFCIDDRHARQAEGLAVLP